MKNQSLVRKLRPLMLWAGFGGAVVALAGALLVVGLLGREVVLITPFDESTVELNRALHSPGDPVAEIYGNPMGQTVRIIAPDKDHLIRPTEEPSLLLLQVDKQKGENPLQAQTIWFFSKFAIPGFVLVGIVGLLLPRRQSSPGVPGLTKNPI